MIFPIRITERSVNRIYPLLGIEGLLNNSALRNRQQLLWMDKTT